jgi:replicative DNA helicase
MTASQVAQRVLPHDEHAENAVIGGILFSGRAIVEVADLLKAEDFYDAKKEAIYATFVEMERRSQPVDLITVADEMRRSGAIGKLSAVGNEAYLAELANSVATVENIAQHARIIRDKATARRLIHVGDGIMQQGYADQVEVEQYLDRAQQAVFDVACRSTQAPYQSVGELLPENFAELKRRAAAGGGLLGKRTGYKRLDPLLSGLQPELLYLVAARPSMGKTAFALCLAENLALGEEQEPVLIFSLEMSKKQLLNRLWSARARVNSEIIRSGILGPEQMQRLILAGQELDRAPIFIDDSSSPTVMEIRTKARRWRADPKLFPPGTKKRGLVIIDYVGLVQPTMRKEGTREQEVAEISRGIKGLAKDLKLPIVTLAQLNRKVEDRADKRPGLADLRESGALEQDADVVLFIYRDEKYNSDSPDKGVAEIIVGKQRDGATDTVRLSFLSEITRFENLEDRRPEP